MNKLKTMLLVLFAGVMIAGIGFTMTACGQKIVAGVEYVADSMTSHGKITVGADPIAANTYNNLKLKITYRNSKKVGHAIYPKDKADIAFSSIDTTKEPGDTITVTVTYKREFETTITLTVVEAFEINDYNGLRVGDFKLPANLTKWDQTRRDAHPEQGEEVAFMDGAQPYTVGHVGVFRLFPRVKIESQSGNQWVNYGYAEKFNTQYKFETSTNGTTWSPAVTDTTADNADFARYLPLDGLFEFSTNAIGKTFRVTMTLPTVTSENTPVNVLNTIKNDELHFEFVVANGYNAYGLDGLKTLNNSHAMDVIWGANRIADNQAKINDLEGFYMHSDVVITSDDLPNTAFHEANKNTGVLEKGLVLFKYNNFSQTRPFTFNGNYFNVNASALPMEWRSASFQWLGDGRLFQINSRWDAGVWGTDSIGQYYAAGDVWQTYHDRERFEYTLPHGATTIKNLSIVGNTAKTSRVDNTNDDKATDYAGGISGINLSGAPYALIENVYTKNLLTALIIDAATNLHWDGGFGDATTNTWVVEPRWTSNNVIKNCRFNNSFTAFSGGWMARITVIHTKSTNMGGAPISLSGSYGTLKDVSDYLGAGIDPNTVENIGTYFDYNRRMNTLNIDTYSLEHTLGAINSDSAWFVIMGGPILGVVETKYNAILKDIKGTGLSANGFTLNNPDPSKKLNPTDKGAMNFLSLFRTASPSAILGRLDAYVNVFDSTVANAFMNDPISGNAYYLPNPAADGYASLMDYYTKSTATSPVTPDAVYTQIATTLGASGPALEPTKAALAAAHQTAVENLTNRDLLNTIITEITGYKNILVPAEGDAGTLTEEQLSDVQRRIELLAFINSDLKNVALGFYDAAGDVIPVVANNALAQINALIPLCQGLVLQITNGLNANQPALQGNSAMFLINTYNTVLATLKNTLEPLEKNNIAKVGDRYFYTIYLDFSGQSYGLVCEIFAL